MRSIITLAILVASALFALAEGSSIRPSYQTPWKRQISEPPGEEDTCFDEVDGGQGTVWGDKLQLLRSVWNDAFQGDFGGSLSLFEIKGVCCQLQCLWVDCLGDNRDWTTDDFNGAFDILAGVVGTGEEGNGWCQAKLREDNFLVLRTAQWDAYGSSTTGYIWDVVGDTCAGAPGYIATF